VSYLERLKQKLSANSAQAEATKPTKPSFVPFVASTPEPSHQIHAANDPPVSEIFLTDAWRYWPAEGLQDAARQLDVELWLERAAIREFDGGHTRADAELMAALDVIRMKGH